MEEAGTPVLNFTFAVQINSLNIFIFKTKLVGKKQTFCVYKGKYNYREQFCVIFDLKYI